MQRISIKVYGRVQGIGFRHDVQFKARQLGVRGFVKNMPDGSVYVEAEAGEKALNDFVLWLRDGSRIARVENLETEVIPVQNSSGFDIRH